MYIHRFKKGGSPKSSGFLAWGGCVGESIYGAPDKEDGLQIAGANMFAYNPLTPWYYHGDRKNWLLLPD
jgi:hypothetical protein